VNRRVRLHRLVVQVVFVVASLVTFTAPASLSAIATSSKITWQACATPELPTRECGALIVPLDYDEPNGLTVSIAVAQVPATDHASRIGSLITNSGGPGGSGVGGTFASLWQPQRRPAAPSVDRQSGVRYGLPPPPSPPKAPR
jgi:hypothetical protein